MTYLYMEATSMTEVLHSVYNRNNFSEKLVKSKILLIKRIEKGIVQVWWGFGCFGGWFFSSAKKSPLE